MSNGKDPVLRSSELDAIAKTLSEEWLPPVYAEWVTRAYEAGFSAAYYGRQSAIAEGCWIALCKATLAIPEEKRTRNVGRLIYRVKCSGRHIGHLMRSLHDSYCDDLQVIDGKREDIRSGE
ncbi:hypothetical protein [Burkholderia territorii]|uniref:hypothetical protein n=1 Tax=Burkholderia territorii TaxID=1503055 RepID=UPI000A8B7056|nr:hypothetical protein [Burkholderia territorii]